MAEAKAVTKDGAESEPKKEDEPERLYPDMALAQKAFALQRTPADSTEHAQMKTALMEGIRQDKMAPFYEARVVAPPRSRVPSRPTSRPAPCIIFEHHYSLTGSQRRAHDDTACAIPPPPRCCVNASAGTSTRRSSKRSRRRT